MRAEWDQAQAIMRDAAPVLSTIFKEFRNEGLSTWEAAILTGQVFRAMAEDDDG